MKYCFHIVTWSIVSVKNKQKKIQLVLFYVNFLFILNGPYHSKRSVVSHIFIFEVVCCIIIMSTETICGKDGKCQKCWNVI